MDSLEYIDNYFNGELTAEETSQFELKIIEDPDFAGEVAYYLTAFEAIKEESVENKKRAFLEIYKQGQTVKPIRAIRKLWPSLAAAALVAGIIFGWYLFVQPVSAKQLADHYIHEHLQKLPVSMGATQDSLQIATNLFNKDKLPEALQYCQNIITSDTSSAEAKQLAGIICLRLQYYDQALEYFRQLETYYDLHVNPSLFYQALTLMKRDRPGDAQEGKKLLELVVQRDLEWSDVAKEWLKTL